jgi:hypothetical protein
MIIFPEALEKTVIFEKGDAQSHFLRPRIYQRNRLLRHGYKKLGTKISHRPLFLIYGAIVLIVHAKTPFVHGLSPGIFAILLIK